jgi:hypothetical protein
MNNTRSSLIIFFQILVSFILGIFGNKVSELVSIKPLYLIIVVIILLGISLLLSIPKEHFILSKSKAQNFIQSNNIILIPFYYSAGFILSMLVIELFNLLSITVSFGFTFYYNENEGIETFAYLYEIVCYLILAILVWHYRKQNPDLTRLFISVIGVTTGVATSILYFKGTDDNTPFLTFVGGIIMCLVILSLIEFFYTFKLQRKSSR